MKKREKNKILLIFVCMFLIVSLCNHFLWLFHDDYGYASLSYLVGYSGNKGMNASLLDVFNFLNFHYQNWGGRVLYFFIEIILLKLGLPVYRLFQSIVTVFIFYLIYKIICKKLKIDDWRIALASALCYGLFEIMVLRGGILWITASVLYFIPLLPFLLFVYLYDGKTKNILCAFLIFISAWSQEQMSVLAVSYILLYGLYDLIIKKSKNKNHIIMIIVAITGFLILMLSPGSAVRASMDSSFYSLSLVGKIKRNIPEILFNNFGQDTKLFCITLFLVSLYFMFKNNKLTKNKKIINISIISTLIILLLTITKYEGYFISMYNIFDIKIYKIFIMLIFFIQLSLILYMIVFYFYKKEQYEFIYLIIGAIGSQASMIMAPYFPLRSVTMFEVVCFLLFVYAFADILKNKNINIYYILIPFFFISLYNMCTIIYGYYINNSVKKYNDTILIKTSEKIKNGEDIKSIKLKRKISEVYGSEEPYFDGYDYINIYIRNYYGLPETIQFIYE